MYRPDVRLLEYEPRHAEPYLHWLRYYDMLSPDRDQPEKWELVAKRAGSIIVAEGIDGEFVGAGQAGGGEGIPMQEGIVVAENWEHKGIGTRLSTAIWATHRFRGAKVVESLTNAPVPLELTDELLAQMPARMRRAIEFHLSLGFELSFGMFGWEKKKLDIMGELDEEKSKLDWEDHPELVDLAIRSIVKMHLEESNVAVYLNNFRDRALAINPLDDTDGLKAELSSHAWAATPWYNFVPKDMADIGEESSGNFPSIFHKWAKVPMQQASGNTTMLLRLIESKKYAENQILGPDGLYVAIDLGTGERTVSEVYGGKVRPAESTDINYAYNSLVYTAWYLNLTPIQRYIVNNQPTAEALLTSDDLAKIALKDTKRLKLFEVNQIMDHTPPVRIDNQKREMR